MAKPPEPLEELLPEATDVVDAEVLAVVSTGETPPQREMKEGSTSVGNKAASQVVTLKVKRALRGKLSGDITVEKPEGSYTLRAGNKGGFMLKAQSPHPVIIGRYGPDTYRLDTLENALKNVK